MRYGLHLIIVIFSAMLLAEDSLEWVDDSWDREAIIEMDRDNETFKKMEIKNRSKREYKDRIYKYIENRDYIVKNSDIEIATVELDSKLKSRDIKVNTLSEDLRVYGDRYRGDGIDIRDNSYKAFVEHDTIPGGEDIESGDPLHQKVDRYNLSEIEIINLKDRDDIKEVNIYIKDVTIRVGDEDEDR